MNHLDEPTYPEDFPRCPFVGLHDDPGTCLSYPSFWNYCYHVKPPASVDVSHQTRACLSRGYTRCSVFLSPPKGALPPGMRGAVPLRKHRPAATVTGIALLALLFVLGVAVIRLGQVFGTEKVLQAFGAGGSVTAGLPTQPLYGNASLTLAASGHGASSNPVTDTPAGGFLPITSGTRAATLTPTGVHPIRTPPQTPNVTPSPVALLTDALTSPPSGVCGHALDVPFGEQVRFVFHRVRSGENLSMYAEQYHTTTEAILAVNYRLPVPVWEHWILVIPVDTTVVSDVPPFEPYQALEAKLSLADLASNLGADVTALQHYNAFDESCISFSGWILVPRNANPQ